MADQVTAQQMGRDFWAGTLAEYISRGDWRDQAERAVARQQEEIAAEQERQEVVAYALRLNITNVQLSAHIFRLEQRIARLEQVVARLDQGSAE